MISNTRRLDLLGSRSPVAGSTDEEQAANGRRNGPQSGLLILGGVGVVAVVLLLLGPDTAQATANGLVSGTIFALGTTGLVVIYSILHFANFAHGDLITLGAYLAVAFTAGGHIPYLLAALLAIVAMAGFGPVVDISLFKPLRRRKAGVLQILLVSLGLGYVVRYALQLIFGGRVVLVPIDSTQGINLPLGVRIGTMQLMATLVGIAILVLVTLGLRYVRIGRDMRAVADNPLLAAASGIDSDRVIGVAWVLSCALAAAAGVLQSLSAGSISPTFGFDLLMSLFAAAIIGGIGNIFGAIAGGITLGLLEGWSTLFVDPQWSQVVGFVTFIIVLLAKPSGLLSRKSRV